MTEQAERGSAGAKPVLLLNDSALNPLGARPAMVRLPSLRPPHLRRGEASSPPPRISQAAAGAIRGLGAPGFVRAPDALSLRLRRGR